MEQVTLDMQFRDVMYGDLPMIKHVIETGKKCATHEDGTTPLSAWIKRLKGWVLNEYKRLSHGEQIAFRRELELFNDRMRKVQQITGNKP